MNTCHHAMSYDLRNGENSALATEPLIVIDLFDSVVRDMKGDEEGKIVMHMDCRKVRELLTLEELKESQRSGDNRLIISEII